MLALLLGHLLHPNLCAAHEHLGVIADGKQKPAAALRLFKLTSLHTKAPFCFIEAVQLRL